MIKWLFGIGLVIVSLAARGEGDCNCSQAPCRSPHARSQCAQDIRAFAGAPAEQIREFHSASSTSMRSWDQTEAATRRSFARQRHPSL